MKKINRQGYLAIFTFIALAILLAVQVNWLFKAAKLEEENFNRLVSQALIESRVEIGARSSTCSDMKNYLCGRPCKTNIRNQKISELDSIIKAKLSSYHINLDYTFEIVGSENESKRLFGAKCYLQSLNGLLEKDGIQISLAFPDRNQFLWAQLQGASLLAFAAVIFVMISFLVTYKMFKREQLMLTQTSDFINNMVHEFQTPLSNIRLATSLLSKKKNQFADEKTSEYINVILSENKKMELNVEKILKVSCNRKDDCTLSKVDIHQLVVQTASEFKTRIESVEGIITFNFNDAMPIINADSNHIKLILSNLIDNAIKYSAKSLIISISTKNIGNNIQLSIKDNGIGIEKKDQGKIFDKYYRVSTGDIHNVKGFGLGLTYVKKIVEFYKGKIEVHSTFGHGTEFIITLPIDYEAN